MAQIKVLVKGGRFPEHTIEVEEFDFAALNAGDFLDTGSAGGLKVRNKQIDLNGGTEKYVIFADF